MSEPSPRSRRWQFTLGTLLFALLCVGGMLAGFQFGYYRGVLQRRAETMSTRVYPIGDLVYRESQTTRPDFTMLIDLITSAISAESWDVVGGPGSIAGTEDPIALVVAQTGTNHDAIAALFADLRAAKVAAAKDNDGSLVLRVWQANMDFGHSTAEGSSNLHPAQYEGCYCMSVRTGEQIVIWWVNNEIQQTPFRFEAGKTYEVQYKGEFEDGVMGLRGKCLHIGKLIKVQVKAP